MLVIRVGILSVQQNGVSPSICHLLPVAGGGMQGWEFFGGGEDSDACFPPPPPP